MAAKAQKEKQEIQEMAAKAQKEKQEMAAKFQAKLQEAEAKLQEAEAKAQEAEAKAQKEKEEMVAAYELELRKLRETVRVSALHGCLLAPTNRLCSRTLRKRRVRPSRALCVACCRQRVGPCPAFVAVVPHCLFLVAHCCSSLLSLYTAVNAMNLPTEYYSHHDRIVVRARPSTRHPQSDTGTVGLGRI